MQTGTVKSYNPHKGNLVAAGRACLQEKAQKHLQTSFLDLQNFGVYTRGWGFVECNGQDSFLHKKELKGQCPSAPCVAGSRGHFESL